MEIIDYLPTFTFFFQNLTNEENEDVKKTLDDWREKNTSKVRNSNLFRLFNLNDNEIDLSESPPNEDTEKHNNNESLKSASSLVNGHEVSTNSTPDLTKKVNNTQRNVLTNSTPNFTSKVNRNSETRAKRKEAPESTEKVGKKTSVKSYFKKS